MRERVGVGAGVGVDGRKVEGVVRIPSPVAGRASPSRDVASTGLLHTNDKLAHRHRHRR